jgi:hypothetical protein
MAGKGKVTVKATDKKNAGTQLSLESFKAVVEKRAKEHFLMREATNEPGDALSDWLAAEREIKKEYKIA